MAKKKKKKKQEKQRANAQDSAYQKPVHLLFHQPIRLAPLAVVHYMGMRDEITSAGLNIY